MQNRTVTASDDAYDYVFLLDDFLIQNGLPRSEVEEIYAFAIEILLVLLPRGQLSCIPQYISVDEDRKSFSLYSFTERSLSVVYSASDSHVHVLSVSYDWGPLIDQPDRHV